MTAHRHGNRNFSLQFTASLDEYEDQLRAANNGLTEVAYDCMRRGSLG